MGKIYEEQIVDMETGEVKTITTKSVSSNSERFGFHRTTEGIEWICDFSGNEMKMLMILLEFENDKTMTVSLSKLEKDHILNLLNISKQYFYRVIKALIENDALVKLSSSDFVLNPMFFYRGGSLKWKGKYEFYNSFKNDKS